MKKLKKYIFLRRLLNDGYLYDKGFIISHILKTPVNFKREPIPWLTYPLIDFLVPRISNNFTLLEYGAGYSTLFFSKYFKQIDSVEHNQNWINIIKNKIPPNCEIFCSDDVEINYVSHESIKNNYDVVLIDGLFRNACAINSIKYINSTGIVIFDDSNRDDYLDGFNYLNDNGFRRLDFWGLSPGSIRNNCTSIFYRENNCLGI